MKVKHALILLAVCINCSFSCTYPSDLLGDWYSPPYGTLTFTSSAFSGFKAITVQSLIFTCTAASGNLYLAHANYSIFTNVYIHSFLCLNLQRLSSIKYVFTLNSNLDPGTGVRFYAGNTTTTLQEACTYTDQRSPGEYELLFKLANISQAFVSCPENLQTLFDVTMTTMNVSSCNGTTLSGQTQASLIFDYSSCVKGAFNTNGTLYCLYYKTDGYTYISTYNKETTNEKSTFTYTCIVYEKSGATLKATEYPKRCHYNQTSTYVMNPGITYVMSDLLYTTSKQADNTTVIIIIVCCVLGFFLVVVVIGIVLYFKFCKEKPVIEAPPKVKIRKRKLSVTEYTPRIMSRSTSVETITDALKKKSTGEILTGMAEDKQNTVGNRDAYEPLPNEIWQNKWENDLHPVKSKNSLKSSRQSLSNSKMTVTDLENDTVLDLKKSYTLSTSLPESLNCTPGSTPRQSPKQSHKSLKEFGMSNLGYIPSTVLPKYQPLIKLPNSTGMFGGQQQQKLVEPILKLNLHTISENPLSRENTSTFSKNEHSLKPIIEYPNKQLAGDGISLSTVVTSRSVASPADVTLQNSFRNVTRASHLSASNASIFDDPTWLVENTKIADQTFDFVNKFVPNEMQAMRTHTWFTKLQKKPEITRKDINYFRNKTKVTTGLNSSSKRGLSKSISSLHIVLDELQRRKRNKLKTTNQNRKRVKPPTPRSN